MSHAFVVLLIVSVEPILSHFCVIINVGIKLLCKLLILLTVPKLPLHHLYIKMYGMCYCPHIFRT